MSNVLVVTWDAGGTVAPAVGIAAELQSRGHRVRVLGHAPMRRTVESEGLAFHEYQQARDWQPRARLSTRRAELAYLGACVDRGTGRDVAALLREHPCDVAVVDCMLLGALAAVRRAGVRHVSLVHTLYGYLRQEFGTGALNAIATVKGMRPRRLWDGADRTLVTTMASLEPTSPLPANARVVGPIVPTAAPARSAGKLLVSLSSLYYPGQADTLQAIVDAVADLPLPVVLTTGNAVRPEELRRPSTMEVLGYVPHAKIMPDVSLVVGHGGHGTTMQALAHDLPMVIVPMFDRSDQLLVGSLVQRAGAGEVVSRRADPATIRAAVDRMLAPGPHRAAAARLGAEIRSSPGAPNAADEIEALL
ncbi:glycosyltransferase [Actinoplanes sp. M2I2]|uniref:glycosyltransferase n=1 Tax=Actinoplanes sp. M2I2 TaxID=1734444 RepID=UPI002020C9E4|nr:glycosyltransferase [Actinoplanes sp. M2I2]